MGDPIGSITSLLSATNTVYSSIKGRGLKKKIIYQEAITSMREALNRTRMFLKHPDFLNTDQLSNISTLWNNASGKVGVLDFELGKMLGDKSRFWSDHELFKSTGKDKELLSLNDIVSEIEKLENKIK